MRTRWTRRALLARAGAVALAPLAAPRLAHAVAPKVVIVGGGAGGATLARQLAVAGDIDITLVEADRAYTSSFFSNWVLAGLRSQDSITHDYTRLAADAAIDVVHARAVGINADSRTVTLADGSALSYDRLVVAPGIDFADGALEGYDEAAMAAMPHAYKGGAQTALLRRQLEAMPDGGTFVMVVPPSPYRCPPSPYERATLVAGYFQAHKPNASIVIVDAKDAFTMQALFEEAWFTLYDGIIEWLPADITGGGARAVHAASRSVITEDEELAGDVVNVIPPQVAGSIARDAGLTDASGWCPVDPVTFESRLLPGVHVIGDAAIAGDMSKSAYAANSQAKACAIALRGSLFGAEVFDPRYQNICWSLVAPDDAVLVGSAYRVEDDRITEVSAFGSEPEESTARRAAGVEEARGWYAAITREMFG